MRVLFFILLSLFLSLKSYSRESEFEFSKKGYVFNFGYTGHPFSFSQYGVQLNLFYQKNHWLFGLKGRFIETKFNNIFTRPEPGVRATEEGLPYEKNAVLNNKSEHSRVRSAEDRWNLIVLQPTVQFVHDFYPYFFPKLKARLGFAFGPAFYKDKVNSLNLKGYLVTTEAGVLYPILPKKNIYLDLGIDFNFGHAWRPVGADPNEPLSLRQIPIYFLVTALSVTWAL